MSDKEIVREMNALTVMPLPVRIPISWYQVLPKVLPLIREPTEKTRFHMPEEIIQMFLRRWAKIFIRRDGRHVWLHLGGVACYEVIPNFVKGIKLLIDGREGELRAKGGEKALAEHWRVSIEELSQMDDKAVLQARGEMLQLLEHDRWHDELGKDWNSAAERAHVKFGKIRPLIRKWIAIHEHNCNLDEPFGGRLSKMTVPAATGGTP